MTWQVFSRPEAENDVIEIANWYDGHDEGLGDRFIEEFLAVLDALSKNPLLHSRRHRRKNIRWRYPKSFPYTVIYVFLCLFVAKKIFTDELIGARGCRD